MNRAYKGVCVQTYFNRKDFQEIAKDAESIGIRRGGSILFRQKEHGFSGQEVANTKNIPKFIKYLWKYWKEDYPNRLERQRNAELKRKEAEAELKRLGGIV
jgi:hypothetical protein